MMTPEEVAMARQLLDARAELDRLRARVADLEGRALEVIGGGPVDLDLDSAEDTANYILGDQS